MKNKVKNILILFAIVATVCIIGVKVYAQTANSNVPETYEVKNEDIPNSTYVIGTHMFTREKNGETGYEGQLSTQLIMLASQTINSDNLNDMIIYYKNPRGKWVNALTENTVAAPETFEISKKDLVRYVPAPVLQVNTFVYSEINQMQDLDINVKNYEDYYSESDEYIYNVSGIEYSRTLVGGDGVRRYEVLSTVSNPDSFFSITRRNGNEKTQYVARAYIVDAQGKKIYSDYSEILEIDIYDSNEKNSMSLDEFKAITNETTLGELKSKYNLESSVVNLSEEPAEYLYDFKGYINNSGGITPNIQFEFDSDKDSATVKAKVYRNQVSDEEIDHNDYDDGDGEIEMSDFDSIELTTAEALMELLGDPYMIKAIYEREGSGGIPSVEYPTIELTYKIKDTDQIINFSFANSGKGKLITTDFPKFYANDLVDKKYVTADGKFELEFTSFNNNNNDRISFTLTTNTGRIIQAKAEARATTLEKLQTDYIFRGEVEGGVIIGRLRQLGNNKFIIDSFVFKKTEDANELPEALNDLNIGYNKLELTLKSE